MNGLAKIICLFMAFSILFSSSASALMSVEEERQMRGKLLQMVRARASLINDPEVIEYVSDIGHKILAHVKSPLFHYEFFVIRDEGMNAFAMPGGLVFVHTGLIENIDSENELACVLAHEIGHVQGRHIARRMERMKRVNIASLAVAVAGLFLGSGQAESAILATSGALSASISLKYSREDEEEADRRAYQWLCAAGYDPRGLVRVLKKMRKYRWLGSDSIPSYLSTHPTTPQRITYLEDLYNRDVCPLKVKEDTFRLKRIQIKVTVLSHDPAMLEKKFSRELKSDPNNIFMLFGLAQSLLADREYDRAIGVYQRLIAKGRQGKKFLPDLGWAFLAAGRYQDAINILRPYAEAHPGDYSVRYGLAKAYLELKRPNQALSLLEDIKDKLSNQSEIALQMGRAMEELGRLGEAHYYFYLHYRETGNMMSARFHRQKALELLPRDSVLYKKLKNNMHAREDDPGGKINGGRDSGGTN